MPADDTVYLGDDVDVHFLAWDAEKKKPIDVTGATLFCAAQTGSDPAIAAARFFIDDGPAGKCRARFDSSQTATFVAGRTYWYDGRVRLQDGQGTQLHTVGEGSFKAKAAKTATP